MFSYKDIQDIKYKIVWLVTHSKRSQTNEKIVGLVNLHSGCGTKQIKQCKRL